MSFLFRRLEGAASEDDVDEIADDVDGKAFFEVSLLTMALIPVVALAIVYALHRRRQNQPLVPNKFKQAMTAKIKNNALAKSLLGDQEGKTGEKEDVVPVSFMDSMGPQLYAAASGVVLIIVGYVMLYILDKLATAAGYLGAGIMLYTQLGTIQTYFRMKMAMKDFVQNNEHFEKNLNRQADVVQGLQQQATMLEQLETKFEGSIDKLQEEVDRLTATNKSGMKSTIKMLMRLYVDQDKDGIDTEIEGERTTSELEDSLEVLQVLFKPICGDDLEQRFEKLESGLRKRGKSGPINVMRFADAVNVALHHESLEEIEQNVIDAVNRE